MSPSYLAKRAAAVSRLTLRTRIPSAIVRLSTFASAHAPYASSTSSALILSSAFFAVLHGHPALAVNAFVMGLILGFIYIETNSIFSVVLLHAMNNGAAFLLIMVGLDGATIRSVIGSDTLYTIVYVVALVLFAASGYMIYRLLARVKKLDKNTIR